MLTSYYNSQIDFVELGQRYISCCTLGWTRGVLKRKKRKVKKKKNQSELEIGQLLPDNNSEMFPPRSRNSKSRCNNELKRT